MNYWILNGREPVQAELMAWSEWCRTANIVVAKDEVNGYRISTVFLGLDHSFGDGPPLLFETMVFTGDDWGDLECERYSTYDEAEAGHAQMAAKYAAKP